MNIEELNEAFHEVFMEPSDVRQCSHDNTTSRQERDLFAAFEETFNRPDCEAFHEVLMKPSDVRQCSHDNTSCPSRQERDLFDAFEETFNQSASPDCEADGDRFGIEGEEDSDKGDGEDEADEPEWEQSRAMFQISNAEADGIDNLIEVHSQDGYVTLKDDVNLAEHTIPRSRVEKAKRLLSLRLISFVIWFPHSPNLSVMLIEKSPRTMRRRRVALVVNASESAERQSHWTSS